MIQTHHIRRLIFEVTIASEEEGFDTQEAVSKAFYEILERELEKLFSRLCSSEEIIRIDKLELDLEGLKEEAFSEELAEKLIAKAEDVLSELIMSARGKTQAATTQNEISLSISTSLGGKLDMLTHFISTGTLPWQTKAGSQSITSILEELIEKEPHKLRDTLSKLWKNEQVRKRFIFQFPFELVIRTASLFDAQFASFVKSMITDLLYINSRRSFTSLTEYRLRAAILDHFVECITKGKINIRQGDRIMHTRQVLRKIVSRNSSVTMVLKNAVKLEAEGHKFATPGFTGMLINLRDVLRRESAAAQEADERSAQEDDQAIDTLDESDEQDTDEEGKPLNNEKRNTKKARFRRRRMNPGKDESAEAGANDDMPEIAGTETGREASDAGEQPEENYEAYGEEPEENDETYGEDPNDRYITDEYDDLYEDEEYYIDPYHDGDVTDIGENEHEHDTTLDESIEGSTIAESSEASAYDENAEAPVTPSKTDKEVPNRPEERTRRGKFKRRVLKDRKTGDNANANRTSRKDDREKELAEQRIFNMINESLSDGIYIYNSGLVLLWPYLSSYFTKLGLVENNKFINTEAQLRAAHLLQYVCSGNEQPAPEYELLLNKIICGLDITEPVSMDFSPTALEKEETMNLLGAVVTNWSALKKTSPEALRSAFLQKEGILQKDSDSWSLSVERDTIDMLIDKLPWGISIIKMPWNDYLLYVQW